MSTKLPAAWLIGLHLGLLQTGLLLALSRAISAAHTTYALVLTAWLAGATLGLWGRATFTALRRDLALGLLAHGLAAVALTTTDFLALSPWWFAPAVALAGLASGRYFTAATAAGASTSNLFARETEGFLLGAVLAAAGYAWLGRHALTAMPLATGLFMLVGRRH
jgi:hypothetical protein